MTTPISDRILQTGSKIDYSTRYTACLSKVTVCRWNSWCQRSVIRRPLRKIKFEQSTFAWTERYIDRSASSVTARVWTSNSAWCFSTSMTTTENWFSRCHSAFQVSTYSSASMGNVDILNLPLRVCWSATLRQVVDQSTRNSRPNEGTAVGR